jgi:protein-S-isoprenylcysteine O-methyltransferase Ste14
LGRRTDFPWTNHHFRVSLGIMADSRTKLDTPVSLAVDALLLVAFFAYMYSVVSTHVPSNDPRMIRLWGAVTASCLTAVFWLALQMFRVVLRAQREAKK